MTAILSFGPVFVNTAFSLDISYIRPKMTLVSHKKKDKQKKKTSIKKQVPMAQTMITAIWALFGHRCPPQPILCLQSSIDGI